jgi:hypothetical protein
MMRGLGRTLSVAFFAFFALRWGVALADVSVPIQLQAQLVSKIGAFDRNFAARAGSNALVLVVEKPGDNDSVDVGTHFASALASIHKVGGTSVQVDVLAFTTAASLAERCRAQRISLVYLSTSLEADVAAIATALSGVDVMTVGATAAYAIKGTVVGFDLEEGKPKIVLNLARAKAQNVSFRAELLKLAHLVTAD